MRTRTISSTACSARIMQSRRRPTLPSGRTRSLQAGQRRPAVFDKAKRAGNYLKAQEIFHEEAPWVPLAHSTVVRVYNKKIHDVPLRPNGLNSFQMIWKEK